MLPLLDVGVPHTAKLASRGGILWCVAVQSDSLGATEKLASHAAGLSNALFARQTGHQEGCMFQPVSTCLLLTDPFRLWPMQPVLLRMFVKTKHYSGVTHSWASDDTAPHGDQTPAPPTSYRTPMQPMTFLRRSSED